MSVRGDGPRAGPRIFLSYRREDAGGYAGHLYADLAARFGEPNVFIDIDSIEPGLDYIELLEETLAKCDTVLVLIGRFWLTAVGRDGKRRIDNPNDLVRFEIERSLSSGTRRIIPVLVGDAEVPDPNDLPESLVPLTRRQAFEVSDKRWPFDVGVLANKIERASTDNSREPQGSQGDTSGGVDLHEAAPSWDPHGRAGEALNAIVAACGPDVLADAETLSSELSERLHGDVLPKERSLLLAASRRDIAADLKEHMSQGMNSDTAVRLASQKLYETEPFDSSGCSWVTNAFARALDQRDTSSSAAVVASVDDLLETSPVLSSTAVSLAPGGPEFPSKPPSSASFDPPDEAVIDSKTTSNQSPLIGGASKTRANPFHLTRRTWKIVISVSVLAILVAAGVAAAAGATHSPKSAVQQVVWSSPASIDAEAGEIDAVSCPSSSFCMAVDNDGNAFVYEGSSRWFTYPKITPTTGLLGSAAVSCPSSNFCIAVDNDGGALAYNGSKWFPPMKIADENQLTSVSCPSVDFCMAVDNDGDAHAYDGSKWSLPEAIDNGNQLTSVSCTSAMFCMAVDSNGGALQYNGSKWSKPTKIAGEIQLTSVSCASAIFCMAVGNGGEALRYNGLSWSLSRYLGKADSSYSVDSWVSCSSSSFCMTVDDGGDALGYESGRWSTYIDGGAPFHWVSCWSTKSCVIVLAVGGVVSVSPPS